MKFFMKFLLSLTIWSVIGCNTEDDVFERLRNLTLANEVDNSNGTSNSENDSDQNTDSSSSNENSSDSTDQQNTDSSSNNPEIGFANLDFDKAIDSQIAKNCEPLEIDGLFFYYNTEFTEPTKQIMFDLIPESLESFSRGVGGYEKLINPKDYYNYSLYLFYKNDMISEIKLINTFNAEVVKDFILSNNLNASDILYQIVDYITNNIENLKTNSIKKSEIKDGIYKYTFASSRVNGSLECNKVIEYSSILNQNGGNLNEFFKITNEDLAGYIIRDTNSQTPKEVWDLSSKLTIDEDANTIVSFSSLENFSNNELIHLDDLNNPIKLVLNTNNDGVISYKTYILEKVNQIGFDVLDSFKNIGFYADEIYNQIDISDPTTYLTAFILDAERHNIDLNYIDTDNFHFELVDEDNSDLKGFRAVAMRSCIDNEILVKYSRSGWEEDIANPYKKSFPPSFGVMWHEFGHDILNLEHLCLGGHIMSGRHQNPQILNSQSECNSEYITLWNMKWDHPNPKNNLERAVDDLFNSTYQIIMDCNIN